MAKVQTVYQNIAPFGGLDQSAEPEFINPNMAQDMCNFINIGGKLRTVPPISARDGLQGATMYWQGGDSDGQEFPFKMREIQWFGELEVAHHATGVTGYKPTTIPVYCFVALDGTLTDRSYVCYQNLAGTWKVLYSGAGPYGSSIYIGYAHQYIYKGKPTFVCAGAKRVFGDPSRALESRFFGLVYEKDLDQINLRYADEETWGDTEGGRYLAMNNERSFVAGIYEKGNSNNLYQNRVKYSKSLLVFDFREVEYPSTSGGIIDIGQNGERIIGLCAYLDTVVVFKPSGLFVIRGTDEPFTVDAVPGNITPIDSDNIAIEKNGLLYFLTPEGLAYYNGSYTKMMPGSDKIKGLIGSLYYRGNLQGESSSFRVLAGGNYILIICSGRQNGAHFIFYDLTLGEYFYMELPFGYISFAKFYEEIETSVTGGNAGLHLAFSHEMSMAQNPLNENEEDLRYQVSPILHMNMMDKTTDAPVINFRSTMQILYPSVEDPELGIDYFKQLDAYWTTPRLGADTPNKIKSLESARVFGLAVDSVYSNDSNHTIIDKIAGKISIQPKLYARKPKLKRAKEKSLGVIATSQVTVYTNAANPTFDGTWAAG